MKLASGIAPVVELLRRGVPVGLGTDGCASNNNLDLVQEMDTAAKLQKVRYLDPTVLPATAALDLATRGSARVLGLEGEVGALAPGLKADLVVLDLDQPHLTPLYDPYSHLVYAATGGRRADRGGARPGGGPGPAAADLRPRGDPGPGPGTGPGSRAPERLELWGGKMSVKIISQKIGGQGA